MSVSETDHFMDGETEAQEGQGPTQSHTWGQGQPLNPDSMPGGGEVTVRDLHASGWKRFPNVPEASCRVEVGRSGLPCGFLPPTFAPP